jgi:hypothetical protein
MREFNRLVGAELEIVQAHRIAGRSDYVAGICGAAVRAWSAFRDSLDALGGDAEPQFDLLAEAFK